MIKPEIKRNYKIEKFLITKDSLKEFEVMENRRQISDKHVSRISGALKNGKNPLGILIVNRIKGKMRLIDGNHRVEAVRKFYGYTKSMPAIECTLKVFENLNDDEEKEIYSDEARRRNESLDDRLNLYKDSIVLYKLVTDRLKGFPVAITIYPSTKSIRFRSVLEMIKSTKTDRNSGFVWSGVTKDDLIPFAQSCSYDDFLSLKRFFTILISAFGDISKNNIYCKRHVIIPLYDIFLKNGVELADDVILERFRMTLGKADLLMYANMGNNREIADIVRKILVDHMNKGHSTNKFI